MAPPFQDLFLRSPRTPASPAGASDEAETESGTQQGGAMSLNPWLSSAVNRITDATAAALPDLTFQTDYSGMHVRSMRTWDTKMPPTKKHIVGGHLVPTVRGTVRFLAQKPRRVSIEVHGPPQPVARLETTDSPIKQSVMNRLLQGKMPETDLEKESLQDNESVYLRVLKESKGHRRHGRDDSSTGDGSSVVQDSHAMSSLGISGPDEEAGNPINWVERGSYKLEDVTILKSTGRTCEVKFGSGNEVIVRDVRFESEKDRMSFDKVVSVMMSLERERAQRQVKAYKKSKKGSGKSSGLPSFAARGLPGLEEGDEASEDINLLVEIVSGSDIPVGDVFSTDAYVVARMMGKEVHRTAVISNSLDPIWTLKSKSLFLLQMSPEQFFSSTGGMTFTLKDYDSLGSNELLGRVNVQLDELLQGTGERTGYEIIPDKPSEGKDNGKLYLRFKEATPDDIEFLNVYQDNQKKVGVYLEETFLPPRAPDRKLLKRQTKKDKDKNVIHRVKPYPNPAREEETTWMTDKQIEADAGKHSTNWTEAGSGDLGKLYFEVIGCDNLPNMDFATLNLTDKTDAFACLIFEDTVVNTDVIGDSLSPRWMPWSRRAFVFNISHPSSNLQVGVFDYDPEKSPMQLASRAVGDLHDSVGRVQINLSNFLAQTVYTLKYNVYHGELAKDRVKSRGTLTVRMRLEWNDRRKALIAGMMPPAPTYVSVARAVDYQVAHYTSEGKLDETLFDMQAFTRYIEELQSYEGLLYYIGQASLTVLLWRGHFPIKLCGKTVLLPLHSLTAFIWGVLVTWDFNMFPSFLLFGIGWLFLACNEYTRKNPSPWHRRRRYGPILKALTVHGGQSETIVTNENLEEYNAYVKAEEDRKARLKTEQEEEKKHDQELAQELGGEIGDATAVDVDIATKKGGLLKNLSVNPLKPVLHPIQLQLKDVVVALRVGKSILLWEETYYAFWIVTFSFVASVLTIWIPWGFLIRWTLRIAAWVFLGPWMAIVDRIHFRGKPNMTAEEKEAVVKERLKSRYTDVIEAASNFRLRSERAVKLKAMKKYMFGKFLLRVPRFSEELYTDTPLPDSSATPYDADHAEAIVVKDRKYGQRLDGDMIPMRDIQAAEARLSKSPSRSRKQRLKFWKKNKKGAGPDEHAPLLQRFGNGHEKEYQSVSNEPEVHQIIV